MKREIIALAACITAISGGVPAAQAQHSIEPGQPIVGAIHTREVVLDAQLTKDYLAGYIDPLELANMRRDLDAIKVKEERYQMRTDGMTPNAEAHISAKLDMFGARLAQKESSNPSIASTILIPVRRFVPVRGNFG